MEYLVENGIIDNWLSAEAASQFFNKLYNDTFVTKFYDDKLYFSFKSTKKRLILI